MKISDILGLLGGLALFLYGMQMMSTGLEAAAGNKMKQILEKLTANRFLGVFIGALITAIIQSSSATTVMVVGFVNSKLMTLQQAVWIIMGANIGTTITGQLIALDVGAMAPLFAFIGVAMVVFFKQPKAHHYGHIIAGLGILFIGMETMSSSMSPLKDMPEFVNLMTKFSNPVLGILVGMIFTAIIQSSSASVGILQTLARNGLIALPSAVYVLFGQNIGTCITAVLASIGTSRNAKRTTIIHLMFNIIGTTIFTIICLTTDLAGLVESFTPGNPAAQIANMHTLFNIVTTIILLPLGTQMAKLATKILPDKEEDSRGGHVLMHIKPIDNANEYHLGTAAIALGGIRNELKRMSDMVKKNVYESFKAVLEKDGKLIESISDREEYIDYLNREISKYISDVMSHELNESDSMELSGYFKISGDLERIGDHAKNISEYAEKLEELNITFSDRARKEIVEMQEVSVSAMERLAGLPQSDRRSLIKSADAEQKIDDMSEEFRRNQLERMREGVCSDEACVLYSEMLTDFERIGDHILNIAEQLANETILVHD